MSNLIRLDDASVQQVDTDTLRQHLAASITLTAQSLAYLATVWRELERRGEDLSDVRTGLSIYLPQIAAGMLDAELVVRYAGQRTLLRAVGRLPITEQRRLAEAGEIEIATIGPDGRAVQQITPLHHLSAIDVRIAFDENRLRTTEEQYKLLTRGAGKMVVRPARDRFARQVRVDSAAGGLLVGGRLARLDRVLEALSEHYGVDVTAAIDAAKPTRPHGETKMERD